MRATDLPFNQRIRVPVRVRDDMEIKMYNLKGELRKITKNVANEIKEDENLTEPQRRGIKGLVRRVKDNELVVFQTDKSGRFSVDTPDNYRESVMPHVGDDPQVSQNDHDAIDKTLTAHGISWVRMLSAGENS